MTRLIDHLRIAIFGLLVVSAWQPAVNADLVDLGDVTRDTDTGLDWLDLSITVQMSRDEVLQSSYVVNEGYRYATLSELNSLYDNAGGNEYYLNVNGLPNPDDYAAATLLIDLMGCTSNIVGQLCDGVDQDWNAGMYGEYPGSPEFQVSLVDAWAGSSVGNAGAIWTDWWTTVPIETRDDFGSYLVRSNIDTDSDGSPDIVDDCTFAANPDQRDTDGDGFGNMCDPDFDQNCIVNFVDLNIMKAFFFVPGDFDTDLNGDGVTNFTDLSIMKPFFFLPPGPSGVPNVCEQ